MSRPRFLADNDLRDQIVDGLTRREPSIEFHVARDVGLGKAPDAEVLAAAATDGFIVVSHDVRTMSKHAKDRIARGQHMPGLFLLSQSLPDRITIDELE